MRRDFVGELVALLRGPGVNLEPTALELAEHGDRACVILDRARAGLVARLQKRSDDFAATRALQAVTAASARLVSQAHPGEQDRVLAAGLSGVDRMRIWLRKRIWPQHRPADTAGETMRGTNAASAPGRVRFELRDHNDQASPRRTRTNPTADDARTLIEPRS